MGRKIKISSDDSATETVIPIEKKWEPGIRDGVFPRSRVFPQLTMQDMVRAIYNKLVYNSASISSRSSGKSNSMVWSLDEIDEKPKKKKKDKDTDDVKGGVWSI